MRRQRSRICCPSFRLLFWGGIEEVEGVVSFEDHLANIANGIVRALPALLVLCVVAFVLGLAGAAIRHVRQRRKNRALMELMHKIDALPGAPPEWRRPGEEKGLQ